MGQIQPTVRIGPSRHCSRQNLHNCLRFVRQNSEQTPLHHADPQSVIGPIGRTDLLGQDVRQCS